MGGEKLSPRQQMISLMYLVLLAMLAMNASKDLLNAFVMIEEGINVTVGNMENNNETTYALLAKGKTSGDVSGAQWDVIMRVQEESKVLMDKFSKLKEDMITETGGTSYDEHMGLDIPLAKDNQDIGAQFVMVQGRGKELREGMANFKTILIDEVLPKEAKGTNPEAQAALDSCKHKIEFLLQTKDRTDAEGIKISWESNFSEHIPMAGVNANIANIQANIRAAEALAIGYLKDNLDANKVAFNTVVGLAQAEQAYILQGDSFKAEIFTAAYDSKNNPGVYLGQIDEKQFKNGEYVGDGKEVPLIGKFETLNSKGGKGKYALKPRKVGESEYEGVIEVKTRTGVNYYPFKGSYTVAKPSATVAATKMNVFYIGVDNPVSVSAPGVKLSDLAVSASGGGMTVKRNPKGGYIVRGKKATKKGKIIVKKRNGQFLGSSEFRVKRLPDPVAEVLQVREGLISPGKLKAITKVNAKMDNFDFDVKVAVKSFDLTMNLRGDLLTEKANGKSLTPKMLSMLKQARRGSRVYFENIRAKMPDGTVRKIPSISLKVK